MCIQANMDFKRPQRENQSEPMLENGFSQPSKKEKKEMKKEGKNILLDI